MSNPSSIVRSFWNRMSQNDWHAAASLPQQTGWQFEELALVDGGDEIVTDMRVTRSISGERARAITFHHMRSRLIQRQTEFWPDPFEVPAWRQFATVIDPALKLC